SLDRLFLFECEGRLDSAPFRHGSEPGCLYNLVTCLPGLTGDDGLPEMPQRLASGGAMHRTTTCLLAGWIASLLCVMPSVRGAEDLPARAQAVLRSHCAACHGPGGAGKGGFDYLLDRDRLVARNQVVPGEAGESPLIQRIEQGEMPPGKRPRPSTEE